MKKHHPLIISFALLGISTASSNAATVANWKLLVAANSPATSGLDTDSPVFGGTDPTEQMDGAQVAGRFGTVATPESVTLAVGETLTVSATIVLTGGTNQTNQVRLGVYNDGGQFAAASETNWTGGWLHSTGNGMYQARTDGSFVSTGGNASGLAATETTTGSFNGDSTASYAWTMTITRDTENTVDLFASFVGGDDNYSNSYEVADQPTTLFTYTAMGILAGGGTNLDRLSVSNAQFSVGVVPEPSTALLGGLGALFLLRRRRD